MKKTTLILALFISVAFSAQAQTENDSTKPKVSLDFSQTSDSTHYVLYVLKSLDQYEEVLISRNKDIFTLIDPSDIQSIEVIKDDGAVKEYGPKAKYGVVVLHFEDGKFKKLKKDLNGRFIDGK